MIVYTVREERVQVACPAGCGAQMTVEWDWGLDGTGCALPTAVVVARTCHCSVENPLFVDAGLGAYRAAR